MNPVRLFTRIFGGTKARAPKRELKPRTEQLDERAVPAALGLGFGGLSVPSYGSAFGGLGAPSFSVLGNNTYGFSGAGGAYNRFGAYNTPFYAFNRPFRGFNRPYIGYNSGGFGRYGLGPGGFNSTTTTPSGPAGLNRFGLGYGGLSYTGSTSAGFTPGGTTVSSPFTGGGFLSTTTTPSGPAGLNSVFNYRF